MFDPRCKLVFFFLMLVFVVSNIRTKQERPTAFLCGLPRVHGEEEGNKNGCLVSLYAYGVTTRYANEMLLIGDERDKRGVICKGDSF